VGIEEARHDSPLPSTEALTALRALQSDVDLIVFFAPWCHSCPFAEGMVQQLAAATDRLSWQLINVDAQRDLALSHGVIRSGRTIVPAILRIDTGEVIFGIERLETRLLDLLGVGQ
jgi:thiol-disulfide isomerase/thioredoxin